MKIYNVALIGCGQMGVIHLEHIAFLENVCLKCVCDIDEERAAYCQRRYRAQRYCTDAAECIKSDDIDIVIIATYPSSHTDLLKLCTASGKHVICEKPMAADAEEAAEFVKIVREHPECRVLVGYILRHNKTYQKVAQMIQDGAIGHPVVMRMVQNHHTMNWKRYLKLIEETSPIIDCGVHYMDIMQWFTGEKIVEINGIGARTEFDVPVGKYNYGLITVKMSGGSIGYYEAGWTNSIAANDVKEFVGPKGRIRIIYQKDRMYNKEEGDLIEYYKYPEKKYKSINILCDRKPIDDQFRYLINMIENNAPAVPSVDEMYEGFEALIEADKKITNGLYPPSRLR